MPKLGSHVEFPAQHHQSSLSFSHMRNVSQLHLSILYYCLTTLQYSNLHFLIQSGDTVYIVYSSQNTGQKNPPKIKCADVSHAEV